MTKVFISEINQVCLMPVKINGVECDFFSPVHFKPIMRVKIFCVFPVSCYCTKFFLAITVGLVDVNINKVGDLWNSQYLNFDWFAVKRSRL